MEKVDTHGQVTNTSTLVLNTEQKSIKTNKKVNWEQLYNIQKDPHNLKMYRGFRKPPANM